MSYTIDQIIEIFGVTRGGIYNAASKRNGIEKVLGTRPVRFTKDSVDRYWSRRLPEDQRSPKEPYVDLETLKTTVVGLENRVTALENAKPSNDTKPQIGYTAKEISDMVGVSVHAIRKAIQRSSITRIPGTQLYTKESVEQNWARKLKLNQAQEK